MIKFKSVSVLIALLVGTAAHASHLSLENGKATFEAVGRPSFMKIKGEGASVTGAGQLTSGEFTGEFTVPLAMFDTGIDMRNEHMREKYLKVDKHPNAVLKISSLKVPEGRPVGRSPFTGTLLLHGVEKPVAGNFEITEAAGKEIVKADFEIKISDYAIDIPSYAGVTVADLVKINIESQVARK